MSKRWTAEELRRVRPDAFGVVSEPEHPNVTVLRAPQKFGNRIVKYAGHTFRSSLEFKRFVDLELLAKAGVITDLKVHPRYSLDVAGIHIANYEGDFEYRCDDKTITEDTKGAKTLLYTAKKRLMKACLGIEVREVTA